MTAPAVTITAPTLPGALCAGHPDPDLWYRDQDAPAAARICAVCPARLACETWAVREDEKFGVWGGTTPNDRWQAKRRRR